MGHMRPTRSHAPATILHSNTREGYFFCNKGGSFAQSPVGIRVVRGTSEVDDETVTYLRPSYHPDGVMRGETSLDKGLYTVFITGEAVPPVHYRYPLRVQMINYANIFRAAIGPLIALLAYLLGYKL